MVKLTDGDKHELEQAIVAGERRTGAELVLSVADMCDGYWSYAAAHALGLGFLVFGALALFLPDMSARTVFLIAAAASLLAAVLLRWRPLRLLTVSREARAEAAARLARTEFESRVRHRTQAANGVLIFVALGERHAEIIPDSGLAAQVPAAAWQAILDALIGDLRAGRVASGLKVAIAACAGAAAAVFPPRPGDENEIEDAPREVE